MNITNKSNLDAAILRLTQQRFTQEAELIEQFKVTRESLNPLKLIRNGISNLVHMPNFGGEFVKTAAGLGVGALSKKLFLGHSSSFLKKILGSIFELAVAKTTISNADKVKAYGLSLYHNLFKKNHNNNHNHTHPN